MRPEVGLSPSNENPGFLGFEIFSTFGIRHFSLGIFGIEIPIQDMYRDSGIFGQAQNQKSRSRTLEMRIRDPEKYQSRVCSQTYILIIWGTSTSLRGVRIRKLKIINEKICAVQRMYIFYLFEFLSVLN